MRSGASVVRSTPENGLIRHRTVMSRKSMRRSWSGFSLVPRWHNQPVGRATFGVLSFLRREGVDGVVIALNRKIDLLRSHLGRHSAPDDDRFTRASSIPPDKACAPIKPHCPTPPHFMLGPASTTSRRCVTRPVSFGLCCRWVPHARFP